PVLSAADVVTLITAGADDASDVAGLTDHLAWHGIAADRHHVAFRSGDGIGATLLDAAKAVKADLLVMGGYGHRPLREALFGGATREVIAIDTELPLLLVH
ncbi:MAG: universal stress protein, partial [Alphaproteobacteria bacterium]|nr:universal stress protein [Alphaproteobacteria bacterium]